MSPDRLRVRNDGGLNVSILQWAVVSLCFAPAWRETQTTQPDNTAIRDYLSANGLANRGLYEMAAEDYRKFLAAHADAEQAPAARYGLAVCLMRMGNTDAAADELALLDKRPQFNFSVEVTTLLGQCRLLQKRFGDATPLLTRVVDKHGEHDLADDAAALRIEAAHRDENFEDAKKFHDAFIARWPKSPLRPRAEYFGGLARMSLQDYPTAAECFLRLTKDAPNDPLAKEATLHLAQCLQQTDASDSAIEQYRAILKAAEGPQVPDALHGLASILLRKGQAEEAGKLLDQFLERFGKHGLASSARILRGRAWFEQGRFDRAERAFHDARKHHLDPALADDAAYWIAKCKLRTDDASAAASLLAEAIESHPQSDLLAEMTYDRAVALSRAGDHKVAAATLADFAQRFATHPLAPDALYLLAASEQRAGNYTSSRKHCDAFAEQFAKHDKAAEVAFLAAENEFLEGRYEPAVKAYRGLLDEQNDELRAATIKLRLGTALVRLKRPSEAAKVLVEATSNDNDAMRPAWLMLGDIAFEQSQWADASGHFTKYLDGGLDVPTADDALLKLGLAEQRQGHPDTALKAFDKLLNHFEDSPQRAQARFERGQALLALKQPEDAAKEFERVLEESRDSRFAPYALTHLGTIAQQAGRLDEAAKRFDEAAQAAPQGEVAADAALQSALSMLAAEKYGDAEKALATFLDSHSAHPRAGEARARRAIALARLNRPADAIKEMDALERDAAATLDPALLHTLRYEKAWCLRSSGREVDALPIYKSLLDSPDRQLAAQSALELADIDMRAKRFSAASELLRRIKPDESTDAALLEQISYRVAVCEYEQGQFAEAAEAFSEFIKNHPKSAQTASANALCGEALVKAGSPAAAVAKLKRVVEKYPDDPTCGPALLRLGETLATLQRWPECRQAFADYLERFSSSDLAFQAQFGVGWAEENQSRHDEAIKAYRLVIDKHKGPTAARAQFQIGECLFAKKEYEAAARDLLKVDILYAYPEWSAAALYEAGRCFEKLERASDARAQFTQVVEKYKDTRWAELARQRLNAAPVATALPGKDGAKSTE